MCGLLTPPGPFAFQVAKVRQAADEQEALATRLQADADEVEVKVRGSDSAGASVSSRPPHLLDPYPEGPVVTCSTG